MCFTSSTANSIKESLNKGFHRIYLVVKNILFRVCSNPVNGTESATVPASSEASLISFKDRFESDNYQWAFVSHGSISGWSYMDTKRYYTMEIRMIENAFFMKISPFL